MSDRAIDWSMAVHLLPPALPVPHKLPSPESKSHHGFSTTLPHSSFLSAPLKQCAALRSVGDDACDDVGLQYGCNLRGHPARLQEWPLLLHTSIGSADRLLGTAIHGLLLKSKLHSDVFSGNKLIHMYVKFGEMGHARTVLDEMFLHDTVTWTTLMSGYCQSNDFESVFRIARDMHLDGENFNERTCTTLLQACRMPESRYIGQQVHCLSVKNGFEEDVFVATSLICMYSRTGAMADAEVVLENLECIDLRCLNSMILGYRNAEEWEKALHIFYKLLDLGFEPNDYTFTNVISACDGAGLLCAGKQLHCLAAKYGCLSEVSVGNALVSIYGKHGLVIEAEKMFCWMSEKNMVSWTAILSAFMKNKHFGPAIDRCIQMMHEGLSFDSSCLSILVDVCSESGCSKLIHQIHGLVLKLGYLSDNFVATAIIDSYVRSGQHQEARQVFESMVYPGTAAFNAVLGCYPTTEQYEEDVIRLFNRMRWKDIKPDSMTFAQLFSVLADRASITMGRSLHAYTFKTGFESYPIVCNSMITMYAKCGAIEESCLKFQMISERTSVSWNAMVSAYALHGRGTEALNLFYRMEREGILPDEITMVAVLQGCRYSGFYEVGYKLYDEMGTRYGLIPGIEHHACMVDLLGRAGNLPKALRFINKSAFANSPLLWKTLVNVCKLHGNIHFGAIACKRLLELTLDDASSFILVANFYSSCGMFEESARIRVIMNERKMKKETGCSWIDINNMVHRFVAGDKDHEHSQEIYMKLDTLIHEMREVGYVPNVKLSPDDA